MEFSSGIYKSWQAIQKQKFVEIKKRLGSLSSDLFHRRLILDIGCGFGYFEREFRGNFIGIDNNLAMLRGQVAVFPRVLAAAEQLPFQSSSFDTIISMDAMHSIQNSDFLRVLKANGLAMFSIFFNNENYSDRKNTILKKLTSMEIVKEFDVHGKEKEYVVVARKPLDL